MSSYFSARPAWVEINLDSVISNIKAFKALIKAGTEIMAVVKADGYGLGASALARAALEAGASRLAVAFVEEGIDLRRGGITAPILLLGYTGPAQFEALLEYSLTPTVFGLDTAIPFSKSASERGIKLPVHLKVDTGMGRVGMLPDEVIDLVGRISKLPGLHLEGFFTHLAAAEEEDHRYTREQLQLFERIIDHLHQQGLYFPFIHAANSAAAMHHPASHYNLLRLGLAMYGYYPEQTPRAGSPELRPVMTFKSKVVLVKIPSLPPSPSVMPTATAAAFPTGVQC